ncbi:hypothetical protein MIND_00120600 [Mycena indigotica]|uniref:C3H1-type domain-containing protein n=1 Tax=Mycena indigotica TaxID=2126181 RepID=A0A8H6WKS1_9AGAR|nr:uncharacterized protein MIND_00120600 [Mycena indigotica]KAF7316029.1 hypothetical protein MIND_00120600 [Mycena indigotica]
MPSAERPASPVDKDDKGGKKSGSSSSKTKDLSHVPCKFFKVGSCTAGSSCPFSHSAAEPGAHKDVCAWFVKGNCKFGHKCALAHILPGQSMSMDRKNKKAAQIAAGATKGAGGGEAKSGRGNNRRDTGGSKLLAVGGGGGRGRPPMSMPLKASISPSVPAPPLKDTDFAALDETAPLPNAPARNKSPSPTLPVSAPRRPSASTSPGKDFGPIGSPPTSPSRNPSGTPPTNGMLSTSPFSAPGSSSVFLNYPDRNKGIAASLGAGPAGWGNATSGSPLRSSLLSDELAIPRRKREDSNEDLEDFIPGSLTDLLTPEERNRRMSRTNSGQSPGLSTSPRGGIGVPLAPPPVTGHRYSRSVPAPSLLGGDLKSIWSNDQSANLSTSYSSATSGLDHPVGTPSSFVDSNIRGLSPSNASGAFLPGIHHYIAQNKQQQHGGALSSNAALTNGPPGLAAYLQSGPTGPRDLNANDKAYIRPNPFDLTQQPSALTSNLSARLGANNNVANTTLGADALSPASRALQAHAPGQSLPQGLAAGYSRIHALPPVGSVSSGVGSPLGVGSPNGIAMGHNGNGTGLQMRDWASMSAGSASFGGSPAPISLLGGRGVPPGLSSPTNAVPSKPNVNASASGLDAMFAKLSYSAAANKSSVPSHPPGIPNLPPVAPTHPPGIQRAGAGGGDDDDLFDFHE